MLERRDMDKSSTSTDKIDNIIWKYLGATLALVIFFGVIIWIFNHFGILSMKGADYWVLFFVVLGMIFSLTLGYLATNEFEYHKFGFELGGISFGVLLSIFSLQMLSDVNLIPDVNRSILNPLIYIFPDSSVQIQNLALIFSALSCTVILWVITTVFCNILKNKKPRFPNVLAFFAFVIGLCSYSFTVVIIIGQ